MAAGARQAPGVLPLAVVATAADRLAPTASPMTANNAPATPVTAKARPRNTPVRKARARMASRTIVARVLREESRSSPAQTRTASTAIVRASTTARTASASTPRARSHRIPLAAPSGSTACTRWPRRWPILPAAFATSC